METSSKSQEKENTRKIITNEIGNYIRRLRKSSDYMGFWVCADGTITDSAYTKGHGSVHHCYVKDVEKAVKVIESLKVEDFDLTPHIVEHSLSLENGDTINNVSGEIRIETEEEDLVLRVHVYIIKQELEYYEEVAYRVFHQIIKDFQKITVADGNYKY